MALRHGSAAVVLALAARSALAAPAVTTELETTLGYSTEGIAAGAGQVRWFGEIRRDLRFCLEGTSAERTRSESDAFGAAFPYTTILGLGEAYVERRLGGERFVGGTRVGRYRTPFGIHDRSDHAYNGFLRPPLVRWGYYHDVSNYWLEGGVDLFVGTPRLQLEASLGTPQEDEDLESRRPGLDVAVRLQAHHGSLIAGASYLKTQPARVRSWVQGRGEFVGIDARWMRNGIQLRGEFIRGSAFTNARMSGWYVDALAHRSGLGPVTPVLRLEEYRYRTDYRRMCAKRLTAGARIRLSPAVTLQANLLHQPELDEDRNTALDVGVTHSLRF